MSQRWHVDEEKQITILISWQANIGVPGLTGYFMVVWETGDQAATRSLPHAYSNLDQNIQYHETLRPYLQALEETWCVVLPAELIAQLEADKELGL